ncbi:hypothetical protein GCM10028815_01770 [Mariniluteicoccus flavus]
MVAEVAVGEAVRQAVASAGHGRTPLVPTHAKAPPPVEGGGALGVLNQAAWLHELQVQSLHEQFAQESEQFAHSQVLWLQVAQVQSAHVQVAHTSSQSLHEQVAHSS